MTEYKTKNSLKYTPELLAEAAAASTSVAGMLRYLGVRMAGGTHSHISRRIKKYGIDTSHFTGQAHNRGKKFPKKTWQEILVLRPEGSAREDVILLRRAMYEVGFEKKCYAEGCWITDTWLDKPVVLHVEHIDGNFLNNQQENLIFLCPMCHSQTDTYCRSKSSQEHGSWSMWYRKKCDCTVCVEAKSTAYRNSCRSIRKSRYRQPTICNEIGCLEQITFGAQHCKKHAMARQTKAQWPSVEEILDKLQTMSYTKLGEELGVSDNAIRKHLKARGIEAPKKQHEWPTTEELLEQLKTKSYNEVARQVGATDGDSVRKRLQSQGVEPPKSVAEPTKYSPEIIAKAKSLREEGCTYQEIAAIIGVPNKAQARKLVIR